MWSKEIPNINLDTFYFMYSNMINECGVRMEGGCQTMSLYTLWFYKGDMLIDPSLAKG